MAGAGYKLYSTGDVLSATDVNTYLQQQTVMVFASSTARTTALSGVLAEGMVSYLQDTNTVEVYNGTAWVAVGAASGTQVAVFTDAKASGAGGTFTSGAWRTRDINTSQFNSITSASIASNQITLPAGTFIVQASASYSRVDQNQARFQNITDGTTAILGQNNYVDPGVAATGVALVQGAFTITASKVFELQHQASSTRATDGFGVEMPFSTEVYSMVSIWKVG